MTDQESMAACLLAAFRSISFESAKENLMKFKNFDVSQNGEWLTSKTIKTMATAALEHFAYLQGQKSEDSLASRVEKLEKSMECLSRELARTMKNLQNIRSALYTTLP